MEQSDKNLNSVIEVLEQLAAQRTYTSVPLGVILTLARETRRRLDDERDARCAIVRADLHRDGFAVAQSQRLTNEIAERLRRQQEITDRLAELERRADIDPDRMALGLTEFFRDSAKVVAAAVAPPVETERTTHRVRMLEQRNETQAETITELERDLEQSRQVAKETSQSLNVADAKVRDLEAHVHALDHTIADVWALVEWSDGYGSPFWGKPGINDTTPAQAVAAVLGHLRAKVELLTERALGIQAERDHANAGRATLSSALDRATARVSEWRRAAQDHTNELTEALGYMPGSLTWQRALELVHVNLKRLEKLRFGPSCHAEAMAALNAADRQADDDQICGC